MASVKDVLLEAIPISEVVSCNESS